MTNDEGTPFRWALAGYGAGGRTFHQPLITSAAGLELVAVVTGAPERQQQVRADLPGATPVASLAELVELGCCVGLTFGQQSWLRMLDIEHHQVLAGTAASMAPGFETAEALAESKAAETYWAKGPAEQPAEQPASTSA